MTDKNYTGTAYIAGPMRGYDLYNFPAFHAADKKYTALGYKIFNPARMDEEAGVFGDTNPLPPHFMHDAMRRDLLAIIDHCDTIILLHGWEKSSGVAVELALAKVLGFTIIIDGPTTTCAREKECQKSSS